MRTLAMAGHGPVAINLSPPGSYVNWNIFTISVANLVLIAVMVAIFGAALLLPFPKLPRHSGQPPETAEPDVAEPEDHAVDLRPGPRGMSGCGRRGCAAAR